MKISPKLFRTGDINSDKTIIEVVNPWIIY